eukprot:gene17793-23401_t
MEYLNTSANISTEVIIHPLVLLSVADHYNRIAKKDTSKRVVGVLLGSRSGNVIDVTNSFAVPFEEDLNNPKVWFLDHNFLDTMYWMFKKVNTRENIVGYYSSGPKIKENDLKIAELFRQFCSHEPVFVVIDVRSGIQGLPTTAYEAIDEVDTNGKEIKRVFKHISSSIGAEEAEEVGVEHLLRDINDPSTSSLAIQIKQKLDGLVSLAQRLEEVRDYLQNVINAIYISAMVRSITALHNLLNNKIKYKDMDNVLEKVAVENDSSKSVKS